MTAPRDEQSGRTTQMLNDAMARANAGERVLVVAANHREVERLRGIVGRDHPSLTVCCPGDGLIGQRFDRIAEDHFVREFMTLQGMDYHGWWAEARARLSAKGSEAPDA